jgi:predicted amidohydrolase
MKTSSEVKLGLVQMSMVKERDENVSKAVKMISRAAAEGADVVCLPELFDSLYFPQQEKARVVAETIPGPTARALLETAMKNRVVLVGGSVYEKAGSKFYNTSVVFDEKGRMIGKYRKIHIPQDPSFYEQNYFAPGTHYEVVDTKVGKVGIMICFDQWYPEPARINKLLGAQILFYPSAIGWVRGVEPVEGDWHEAWESVQRGHAIANSIVVAAVNRVGVENEMSFWGGSFVCDQFGKMLIRGDDSERVLVTSCCLKLADEIETGWGFLRNRKPKTYRELCE